MKSIIVFYIPSEYSPTNKKDRKKMVKSLKKNMPEGSHVIVFDDPTIKHIKTEVFFNPYQL